MKTYSIVGMNFTKTESFVAGVKPGARVVLVREPNNAYDANAVAVWIEGRKVGFIPKKQNAVLAGFIDQTGACDSTGFAGELIAMDQNPSTARAIVAKFVRSPNSSYPMVEV